MTNTFLQMTGPLKKLAETDPVIAGELLAGLTRAGVYPHSPAVGLMVSDVLYGLSLTKSLGRAIANGYIRMTGAGVNNDRIERYSRIIRREGGDNSNYAESLAGGLGAVLAWGDDFLVDAFLRVAALMKRKWFYALSAEPLEVVSEIIGPEGIDAGCAWLKFSGDVLVQDLTYDQLRRFSGIFPRAVLTWPTAKRVWRINQLRRIVGQDFNLACVFAEALNRELSLLSEKGLEAFVSEGLTRYAGDEHGGIKFLGLATQSAVDACLRLRTTGLLSLHQRRLESYLQARCGRTIPVRPISVMAGRLRASKTGEVLACFDGRAIFLSDEISRYATYYQNDFLYQALVWIEAGLFEFNTFDFDFEKFKETCSPADVLNNSDNNCATDLEQFFNAFPDPGIARDLFTVFEYGRVRTLLEKVYPGGAGRYLPLIRKEAEALLQSASAPGLISVLFAGIVLQSDMYQWISEREQVAAAGEIADIFNNCTAGANAPEASARGVLRVLTGIGNKAFPTGRKYLPLQTPFGLRVRPELFQAAFASNEKQAGPVNNNLAQLTVKASEAVIRRRLREQEGRSSADNIRDLIQDARRKGGRADEGGEVISPANSDIDELYSDTGARTSPADYSKGQAFRYHEWDQRLGDYLADYVMVRQREPASGDTNFYEAVLSRNSGLVKKIRYAFEMLKPGEISILRKWREGDDFDYRQLLEYAVDKKSGRTPSERIYIKRLKQQRDVAVLLLLDFSRSTSNKVAGSETTMVMDVEKEALVLFCEALRAAGDPFAIAGFSGTGRLGVDYFPVKSFAEKISADVRRRIGAVAPQYNTRMGAAIRHAAAVLEANSARSKLLIIISDGFPNDIDYKRDYALADTRRSLLEAKRRGIAVHNITINIAGDVGLDNLYGRFHNSVISNVRELPDKLIRIYGRLTG